MSSFMIWHKIVFAAAAGGAASSGVGGAIASAFGFGLPLTVSNNVYSLGLVLDADVELTMSEGATADGFTVTVYDLPDKDHTLLASANKDHGLTVTISLGYFDNPGQLIGDHPVMRGRAVHVNRTVGDDGRAKIVVDGLEATGYLMKSKPAFVAVKGHATLDSVVQRMLDNVNVWADTNESVHLAPGSTLGGSIRDYTIVGGSALAALTQLADLAEKPIVIADRTIALGPAVGATPAPVTFDPATNIVTLGTGQNSQSHNGSGSGGDSGGSASDAGGASTTVVDWHELTVLGHPGLRVGQAVTVTGLDAGPTKNPVRISRLVHKYSTTSGYTCQVSLTDAAAGTRARPAVGVAAVVDRWNKTILDARQDHPTIDVGQATAYRAGNADGDQPKNRVTLNYRQIPDKGAVAPSTDTPVGTNDQLINKPVASPFAFDKVGLVTPVYPGMRAVLVHNRSIANDAIVAGWIWPSQPPSSPPPNHAGDYWLALPTQLGGDGHPTGKGVHDLTDARGCRVIHARALHLLVGTNALQDVGVRPDVPDDDTITIEHSSGTTITIDSDGKVSLTTQNKAITFSNGSVSLKIDGTSVAVS